MNREVEDEKMLAADQRRGVSRVVDMLLTITVLSNRETCWVVGKMCCRKKGCDTVGELRRAGNFTPYAASSNIESLENPIQKDQP